MNRRSFLIGLGFCAVGFLLVSGAIAAFGTGRDRPEGVAERWLTDVGDTTRKGVRDDARARAEEVGSLDVAAPLLPDLDYDQKAAFADLEVGRATHEGDVTRVPFRLDLSSDSAEPSEREGTLLLQRVDDRWHVVALDARRPDEKVPSEGGDPVSKAPLALYAGAIGLGLAVTVGASLLVGLAGRSAAKDGDGGKPLEHDHQQRVDQFVERR